MAIEANSGNSSPSGNGRGLKRAIGAVAALGLAAWGVVHVVQNMAYVSTDDAYVEGRIHQIASKVSGTVKNVLVVDNQRVSKGTVLLQIDTVDYEVKVKEAEALLLAEKAKALEAETRINTAQAWLEIQETTLKQARLDAGRAERLFADGALSKEKLEKAQTARDLAIAQVKAAREQILQARANKDIEAALVRQREAVLENARLNLGYTKITAPADGFVTKKSVEEGNQIQAGQPLMAVVALDGVWVAANFKETQLKDVRPGQPVVVHVDMYPGKKFTGKVESVMAGTGAAFSLFPPENALGNYVKVVQRVPVKIVLDATTDQEHLLRVGMSVIPKIRVKGK